jgi:hypothetical protein
LKKEEGGWEKDEAVLKGCGQDCNSHLPVEELVGDVLYFVCNSRHVVLSVIDCVERDMKL